MIKGAGTALQVAEAIEDGLLEGNRQLKTNKLPLADGGEGTLDILGSVYGGKLKKVIVNDPLGRPMQGHYLMLKKKAVVELAVASGLPLLATGERNPIETNTFGTGQLIHDAINMGCEEIILSIGGSATNDAGVGIATALGFRFYDQNGHLLSPKGGNLGRISRIESPEKNTLNAIKIKVLCDVTNPFTGLKGAVSVYSPQKGAGPDAMELLEHGMVHFRDLIKQWRGIDLDEIPGSGAAGGVGGGMVAFFNAELVSGIDYLMDELKLEEQVKFSDLIITAEGSLDNQTFEGKTIGGLLKVVRKWEKPVIALAGNIDMTWQEIREAGLTAAFSIQTGVTDLPTAMSNTLKNIRNLSANLAKVLRI